MEQHIKEVGGIAGAVGAVIGLGITVKKICCERKLKKHEFQNLVLCKLDELAAKIDDTQEDVAYIQMHELKRSHAFLMKQGWCSDEEKASLLAVYDRYKVEKKRDSLIDSFAQDIKDLKPFPPKG